MSNIVNQSENGITRQFYDTSGVGTGPFLPMIAVISANGALANTGSLGVDLSVNKPTLPNVGANFANSGVYASYLLLATIPASNRSNYLIVNTSGAQIVVIRDDGTAANNAAPVNATVYPLAGGPSVGSQGSSDTSVTFKGRLQIYSANSSSYVSISIE